MGNPTDSYDFKYYHEGFFGYSLTPVFEEFSFWHFLPVLLLVAAIWLVYRYRKQIAAWKGEETLRFVLGNPHCAVLSCISAAYHP